MSHTRIYAILLQEFFFMRRSVEVLFDVLLFPLVNVVLFAFLSTYIGQSVDAFVVYQLLLGSLLWQFMYIVQYSVSVHTMWNLWARNLSNIFITPIHITEYFTAAALSGAAKSTVVFVFSGTVLMLLFDFNVFEVGVGPLALYMISLWLFAVGVGIIILGLIFRFGTRISAFSWGFLPILQPLMATLFPRTILPAPFDLVALLFPPTYVFEAARWQLQHGTIYWHYILMSYIGNLLFVIMAIFAFRALFRKSQETGQFVRNE